MKSILEKTSQARHAIKVEVTAEAVDKAYDATLLEMGKEVKLPGFRQGKVPAKMIEQRFGDELNIEAVKRLVRDTYPKAIVEAGVHPISDPEIDPPGKLEKGKPFSYRASFDVYPEFEAAGYEGLKLEREKTEVSDAEVEAELKNLQRQMTQLEPVPDAEIGPGMVAMIDFKGTAGGEPFPGSEAENYVVDFGTGNLLEEFEVKIKGMKAKEERDISFTYPESYFKKEVAGKTGEFKVKVKDLRRKITPELTDDFAKELGKYASMKEVLADIKKRIAEYKDGIAMNMLKEQAIRQLIEKHKDLEVPTTLIEAELSNMLEQLDRQLKARGQSLKDTKVDAREFVKANTKEATDRARGYMVVGSISRKENVQITDEDVQKRIEAIAAQARQPAAKVKERFEKDKLMDNMRSQLVFEKTLELVVERGKVHDKK